MTENSGGNAITEFGYQFRTAGVIGGGSGSGAGGAGRSHWRLERRCWRLARIHGRRAYPNWDFSGIPPREGGLLEYFPIT